MWQTATLLSLFCVMVLRKYDFSLRNELKQRSASQEEAGRTSKHLISLTTSLKSCLTSLLVD
jgi:hypothetical protein